MNGNKTRVESYYDAKTAEMIKSNRLSVGGNKRVRRIMETLSKYVKRGDSVLEIGCGIGVMSEFMIRQCRAKEVTAIDISGNNIRYAQDTVQCGKIRFVCADVLEAGSLAGIMGGRSYIDCVVLADVIEHIPIGRHETLIKSIAQLLAPQARLILTYPSPFSTQDNITNNPSALQVVDEIIHNEQLCNIARYAGALITYYELVSVWKELEYTHVIMEHHPKLLSRVEKSRKKELLADLLSPLVGRWLAWKYGKHPFGKR